MIFRKRRTYIIILSFILFSTVFISFVVQAAEQAHRVPEMVYRIRIANDLDFMSNKLSGIKVNDIRLPSHDRIRIDDNPWSYLVVYLGIENIWFWEGNEMLHAVEAGVSIRGTEVHEGSGWHSFINYYPGKKYEPFNDPDAWRGEEIAIGEPFDLELQVGEMEEIGGSYRWNVHYLVNGREVAVRPIYANPGQANQFDVKLCIGTYMSSGDENEVSFGPVKIGDIEISESSTRNKVWKKIRLEDLGIPNHRIGYATQVDTTEFRKFNTDFETANYSYSVSLPKKDNKDFLLFLLLAGLTVAATN